MCSGAKTAADQLPLQPAIRLPFTNTGEIDKLYLEALHTRSWQHGQTTLPFEDWCRDTGINQAIKEGKLHMAYPKRYERMWKEDIKKPHSTGSDVNKISKMRIFPLTPGL